MYVYYTHQEAEQQEEGGEEEHGQGAANARHRVQGSLQARGGLKTNKKKMKSYFKFGRVKK